MTKSNKPVVLIRPPIVASKKSFSAPVTPPVALAYLSATLIEKGHSVVPIDAVGEDIDSIKEVPHSVYAIRGLDAPEIIKRIPHDPLLIGVSCMFSQDWLYLKELLRAIKKVFPQVPLIVGGEHITALPLESLEDCEDIDIGALGEGEETILDLVDHFKSKTLSLESIHGIVYRDNDNTPVKTQSRSRIKNIDDIPRPRWDILPIEVYLKGGFGHGVNKGRTMPIVATRGCPYQCTFCSSPSMWTTRYNVRPPSDVIDEIKYYKKFYQVDQVDFYDLTAIINKNWFIEFANLLKKEKLNVIYSLPSGTRSEALDEKVTALMAETQCNYLVYAAESGSERILNIIKKRINLKKMMKSMKSAKKNGMTLRCNLMIGFPFEKRLDVLKTMWFQVKLAFLGVDDAPLYMFSPYPGSAIFKDLREKKVIGELDKEYYEKLICQMDLSKSNNICENVSAGELIAARIIGMSLFYGISYLLYPHRIFRSIRNIFFTKMTSTVFEQRLVEAIRKA